jgi:hypothetical protein
MPEPVFFISHFAIKEGALDALKGMSEDATERLRQEKPRTVLFLSYLDEEAGRISFLHAFPDAAAMDEHVAGADERSAAAYEFMEPRGWEIYGRPSEQVMEGMRATAERFGVALVVEPEFNGGFLRLGSA